MQRATVVSFDLISEHSSALLVYEIKDSTGREFVNSFSRQSNYSASRATENFGSISGFQAGSGAYPASYPRGTVGFSPGAKRPGREAHRSSLSSRQIRNAWICTSVLPLLLHGMVLN
jgi:hypothetical protein